MIKVSVKIKHEGKRGEKNVREVLNLELRRQEGFKKSLWAMMKRAKRKMINTIGTRKKRHQAGEPRLLEESIEVEKIFENKALLEIGLGNIADMTRKAPHWRAIDQGSIHLVGTKIPPGPFRPGLRRPSSDSDRRGRLKPAKKGGAGGGMIVTNPITPMRYVQHTRNFVSEQIQKLMIKLKK